MTPADVVAAIRFEMHRRGWSALRTAREAGLPANAIRYVLEGREPRLGRLIEICNALGLKLYVQRTGASADDDQELAGNRLQRLESIARTLNRVVMEVGGDPIPEELPPVAAGFRSVTMVDLASAAPDGAAAAPEQPSGVVWFRSDWLAEHGLDAAQCSIIKVRGESMEPTFPDGCSVLVNRTSRGRQAGRTFVLRTVDGVVVKRLALEGRTWFLVSSHPDWPPVEWPAGAEIVGRVEWMAMSL
ncbi:MAG: LexA family transcriptional regulator [Gammaproteobacteria bacterium]|nr:LexA family transcriptional regulator [Gammaproteobacteria bacterium]